MPEFRLTQEQSLRQEQILAPAQLQSLELLIAPIMELQAKISEELETNPVLEQEKNDIEKKADNLSSDALLGDEKAETKEDDEYSNILQLAESLRSTTYPDKIINNDINTEEDKYNHFFNSIIDSPSIEETLNSQLSFYDKDEHFKELCKLIIGSINESGYFQGSLQDLAVLGGSDKSEMEKALEFVQSFDPPGIAARDLRECLLLQLNRKGEQDTAAAKIVSSYLNDLASNRLPFIAKKLDISMDRLKEAIAKIRKLSPYPWTENRMNSDNVVIPEILIQKIDGEYKVILKNEYLPKLRISKHYLLMLEDPDTPKDIKEYIKEKVLKANTIIKNIQQRQETIKKITEIIIDTQYDFFENGLEHLKPLTMKETADKIGVHETTVSRAVANKYCETPQGVFELRYFFTTGYQSESGDIISNKSVMEKIKDIVADEDTSKPYSDEAISKILKKEGLNVARRTVTKYREEIGIPSSRQRKEYN